MEKTAQVTSHQRVWEAGLDVRHRAVAVKDFLQRCNITRDDKGPFYCGATETHEHGFGVSNLHKPLWQAVQLIPHHSAD